MPEPDPVEELLPLNPPVFHILLALAGGDGHGYGIMQEVEERTGGRMRLGPGTLYYSIRQMLGHGLIEECGEPPGVDAADERRRYYRVTERGRAAATAEARRMAELVELARARDVLPGT